MDPDAVMLFIKGHPDCSSLDIAEAFGVTVAKAFTFANMMVEKGMVFKTIVRSPTNNKKILGYRTMPDFDEVGDNGDGSMKNGEAIKLIRRYRENVGEWNAVMLFGALNDWRRKHGVRELDAQEVFGYV